MKKSFIETQSSYTKAYQKSIYLKGTAANMAAANERRTLLGCWVHYYDAQDKGVEVPAWVRPALLHAVSGLASPDLRALLPAIPTRILIDAIRVDGTINVPSVGKAMAAELAANSATAVAVAQAAQAAQKAARHEAQKAAKKAALAAKKAAKKAAAEYTTNNTCGLI